MGSTRLPGKAMLPIFDGKGALELMLERLATSTTCDRLVVATTALPEDDTIESLCARVGVRCCRGDPEDVLDRYYHCAVAEHARDIIVRLTGDCPLHDPAVVDAVVEFFIPGNFDYASNTHPPTFPDGLDIEVFSFAALETAWRDARLLAEREHVTYHIYMHPEKFCIGNFRNDDDLSSLRWTLDEPDDLVFIRAVYEALGPHGLNFSMQDVLALLQNRPDIARLNAGIMRDEGLQRSLAQDRKLGNLK